MDENVISKLSLNDDLRDIEDERLREEIINTGLRGHIILDSNDTEFPTRSKLQIKYGNLLDDPVNNKTIISPKENVIVDKPIINVGEYTYNGEPQGPEIIGLTDDMIVQNATNINAGTYQLIISLKEAPIAFWSDSTTAPLVYEYTINKAIVTIPTVSGTYIYSGSEKRATISNIDENLVLKSGDLTAVNAGTYTVQFELKDIINYIWKDGTDSIKSGTWIINKAATEHEWNGPVRLDATTLYKDLVYNIYGSATNLSFRVENTNIATITILNIEDKSSPEGVDFKKVTCRISAAGMINDGRTRLFCESDDNENYYGCNFAESIYVDTYPELNSCTWEYIKQISDSGNASSYWSVGDTKRIALNGQIGDYLTLNNFEANVFILDFNHNSSIEGTGISFGCFSDPSYGGVSMGGLSDNLSGGDSTYDFSNKKTFNINHFWTASSTYDSPAGYGGWAACDMRYDILGSTNRPPSNYGNNKTSNSTGQNPTSTCATSPVSNTLMAALPSDLRTVMKPITKYTDNSGGMTTATSGKESSVTATIDYLPLLAPYEVYSDSKMSSISYINTYEKNYQTRYQYFSNGNSPIIKSLTEGITGHGKWGTWSRSCCINNTSSETSTGWIQFYGSSSSNARPYDRQCNFSDNLFTVFLV